MKKTYTKPCIFIEEFVANDYIAACGQVGGTCQYTIKVSCYDHGVNFCSEANNHVVILKKLPGNDWDMKYEITDFLINGVSSYGSIKTGKTFNYYTTLSWSEKGKTHNANLDAKKIQQIGGGGPTRS